MSDAMANDLASDALQALTEQVRSKLYCSCTFARSLS